MNNQEKNTVSKMIKIYCRSIHKQQALCADCVELENYAHRQLERCPFGESK
ncbi:MAG: nitrous oxide-stimulated promoter family protein, partial [Fibromonadaceae bacterium]|nr:nitrous oxide-stimulated promoter family protein [Fibromonadaceae bacterium]